MQSLSASESAEVHDLTVQILVCVCTIDCKDIFDLLLYDFQTHFNSIGASHGMDLIGVQPPDVHDLQNNNHITLLQFSQGHVEQFAVEQRCH